MQGDFRSSCQDHWDGLHCNKISETVEGSQNVRKLVSSCSFGRKLGACISGCAVRLTGFGMLGFGGFRLGV